MKIRNGAALTVIPVPGDGWRVSDPSVNEADGRGVLGFVERSGDFFAVLPLADPSGVRTYRDFSSAVESLAPTRDGAAAPSAPGTMPPPM